MNNANRLIITRWNGRLLTALVSQDEVLELGISEEESILGNIYIGKVKKVVGNLNSAFVEFSDGRVGYYSLTDNPVSVFAQETAARGKLREGDEIVVQVAKDAVKTKDPVLSANLTFTGKYAVLTTGRQVVGFSTKIVDREWKEQLRPQLEQILGGEAGVIVRTAAYRQERALFDELSGLLAICREVRGKAAYRTCKSLLYQAEPEYLRTLKSCPAGTLEAVVTDDPEVYEAVARYLSLYQPQDLGVLRMHQDPLVGLSALYSLETAMHQACQKRVWLKSGGYLVIEPTEAMVVIDVNTGKYTGKKKLAETIRMTNFEAAAEICHQLRLRNLTGIILIDFIDMKEERDRELLLDELRALTAADPVKTAVVDMTPLGLVEMTRKKGRKPLLEQLQAVENQKGISNT